MGHFLTQNLRCYENAILYSDAEYKGVIIVKPKIVIVDFIPFVNYGLRRKPIIKHIKIQGFNLITPFQNIQKFSFIDDGLSTIVTKIK